MVAADCTACIDLAGLTLRLLPERAAYVGAHRALLVADVHLGKAASFGRQGVPVPERTTEGTIARMEAALERTAAERVIFLGDLMHSAHLHGAAAQASFERFRRRHAALTMILVAGNHDARAGAPPAAWGLEVVAGPLALGPLALVHEPLPVTGAYAIGGHIHPAVVLGARGFDRVRLPCFHFGPEVGVLPAFGEFTGMHRVSAGPGERVYVVADGRVRGPLPSG
jgi:DNA ligase-associated metallophosphoesterase